MDHLRWILGNHHHGVVQAFPVAAIGPGRQSQAAVGTSKNRNRSPREPETGVSHWVDTTRSSWVKIENPRNLRIPTDLRRVKLFSRSRKNDASILRHITSGSSRQSLSLTTTWSTSWPQSHKCMSKHTLKTDTVSILSNYWILNEGICVGSQKTLFRVGPPLDSIRCSRWKFGRCPTCPRQLRA